jgi:hypothetical protein
MSMKLSRTKQEKQNLGSSSKGSSARRVVESDSVHCRDRKELDEKERAESVLKEFLGTGLI